MKKFFSVALSIILMISVFPLMAYASSSAPKTVGDLDADGEITDWDGVLLARYLAGWTVGTIDAAVMDADGDGEVTDWDGVILDRMLAGWTVSSEIGKKLCFTVSYTNTKGAFNDNPTSVAYGNSEIPLTDLFVDHYVFDGWYNGEREVSAIPAANEGDLKLTAKWTPIDYMITYTNTKGAANSNPARYNIDSNTITLKNISCDGYLFDGWYNGSKKVETITSGTFGNITLAAKWTACEYTITYANTKGAANSNPVGFNTDSDSIVLADLSKDGYVFDGWYVGNQQITEISKGTIGNITLTAQWTPIEYFVTYENTLDVNNANPLTYTVESETITLSSLAKDGYEFVGWYNGSKKVETIATGSFGNITLTAKWTACEYTITYANTKGASNSNPVGFNTDSDTIRLLGLQKDGYEFDGWYVGDQQITEIPKGTISNITLTAQWAPIEYFVTYENTLDVNNANPLTYTVESETITLSSLAKDGYEFVGWYNGSKKVETIATGSFGNITLTAKWTACEYTITYANTKGASNSNPVGFNTDSETITLSDIQKEGYVFDGWYQNGVKVTQIAKGTIGNVELSASWTPITYSATFVAEGEIVATRYFTIEDSVLDNIPNVPSKAGYIGAWQSYTITADNITIYADYTLNEYTITYSNTKGAENFNPTTYAITTETFELLDLQYDGYNFEGWYKGNTKVEQIEKGSYGNVSLTAKWSAASYTITYSDTKGATNNNPLEYTVETGTIYLKNISAEHYTFDGWYLNGNKVLSIPAGNIGNIELVARWTPISYNLLYQNTKGATNSNTISYTVEDVIILQEISADGYIFDGWYLNGEKAETINVGSYGQKILSARWTPITYSITYKNTKGAENSNLTSYTIESNAILLSDISATGYTFDGWYVNGSKVDKIDAGTFGDLEITAHWTPIVFTLTYEDTKGATNNNPLEYTIENAITLQDISVDGYTFEGWYVGDEKVTTISIGTIGHKTLTAKWSLITYSITYANTKDVVHNNLCEYTIESDDIKLADISKEGYVFNGWDLNGEVVTKVDSGSFGNITITALWTPNTYSISYVSKYGDINNGNPIIYNTDSEIALEDAFFDEYHTFEGWFLDSNFKNEIEVLQGSRMQDMTLYAKWSFNGTYISSGTDFETIVYDPSGAYELTNNISISATICDSSNSFKGYINGNDYVISGAQPFGVISGSATVRNIKVANHGLADTNSGYVYRCIGNKGLITTNSGTIKFSASNSGFVYTSRYASGTYDCVAGLVARNTGRIIGCYSSTTVDVTANSGAGLVGDNNGSILNSYFKGSLKITCVYPVASGIVASGSGTIENCYSSGTISIVAKPSGTGPYATSAFGVTSGMGADSTMTIKNSFSCVRATAGIFVSSYYNTLSVSNCYYASDLCSCAQAQYNYYEVTNNYSGSNYGTGTNSSNFKSASFVKNTLGWSTDYWCLSNGQLPKLIWE